MLSGFKQFILRGNVVDLAVAVAVGAAFNSVVSGFTSDFIDPLISLFGGKANLSFIYFSVYGNKFLIGSFINSLITFLIDAAVIYFFVVSPINKLVALSRSGKTQDPTTKRCPQCLSEIPFKATRCSFCTQPVPEEPDKKE